MKTIRLGYFSFFLFTLILLNTLKIVSQNNSQFKEVYGKITYQNQLLLDVNISIVGETRGTKTNKQGNYKVQVKVGDKLKYSYIGFQSIFIIVEDITKVLNIKMKIQENVLDEVYLKSSKRQSGIVGNSTKIKPKIFTSAFGVIDTEKAGYSIGYVNGNDLNLAAFSIVDALLGKVSNYKVANDNGNPAVILRSTGSINSNNFAIWDVDGMIFAYTPPPIDLSDVKDVFILKSLAGTVKYGSLGAGGVIIVRTKHASFDPAEEKRKVAAQYTNKETYKYDATIIDKNNLFTNSYSSTLLAFKDKQKAFEYYTNTLKKQISEFSTHLSIARDFNTHYKDKTLSIQILKDLSEAYAKNPELLKAVAYLFQAINAKEEAIKVYQNIFELRPNYGQSYRDLANAYRENGQYQRAWRIYMNYLLKGNDISGEGIGQLLYNEMEWLYFNKKNQAQIKVRFVPKNQNINDFRNDVRLVFEWNTSEAEFDLEFVNPKKIVYTFKHSLEKNQDLITDEKEKGYSSKEFIIDDLQKGEWLVNFTYQGNKKLEPTYLKVTQYYNWGKPNQTEKIDLYRLQEEQLKIQLYRFNKPLLMVVK